ncbi:MAG: TIGR04283 family arsenosugar biosynthesis glycosyltransferase [Vicinamibacterales bacterium]
MSILASVIIPVYHDAAALERTLALTDFSGAELIVAATPRDRTLTALRATRPDIVWIDAPAGRAIQMNAGAAFASAEWLLFLHADTRLPSSWTDAIAAADQDRRVVAGCFAFALDSPAAIARVIEIGVRVRVALFGLPYGDQALFVRRRVFEEMGGYGQLPIMEDVDLVRRLARRGRLYRSPLPALTSARRWHRDGWITRTGRHLFLIALYLCGVPPSRLIRLDAGRRTHPDGAPRRISL